MKHPQWRPGSFAITTKSGKVEVKGYVSGNFGIRDHGQRRPTWSVTHLASGQLVTPGTAGFSNLEFARALAERLAALADWNHFDDEASNRALGRKVAEIWNELIALDVAKTITDHYGKVPDRPSAVPGTARARKRA